MVKPTHITPVPPRPKPGPKLYTFYPGGAFVIEADGVRIHFAPDDLPRLQEFVRLAVDRAGDEREVKA